MNDVILLTFRRLRVPLIVMLLVYFMSVIGMVMIPGQDSDGNPVQVNYLDAAYFVAIMATTIGFGEIPGGFTPAQRLYVFVVLFPNVIAWLYSFGTILSLLIDPQFRAVMRREGFEARARRLSKPFFVVCGFGNTGGMIVRALLHRGYGAVVLEREEPVVHGMVLDDEIAHVPALAADVTDRENLEMAGLHNPLCQGMIAITNEDHANLTIALTSKLLRPDLPVLARSETERTSANMASFGTDHIVDPYAIFAERFYLALNSPTKYLVQDWLISVPGTALREPLHPPAGRWILCGVGRFGSRIVQALERAALPYTIVDVHPDRVSGRPGSVLGRGTEAHTLEAAGIADAAGVVAGTGDDIDNLSIIMTARELNPRLFLVARQERRENEQLFDASGAHLVARRSLIVARRILSICTTPLLQTFLQHLVSESEDFALHVAARLQSSLKGYAPSIWTLPLSGSLAGGLNEAHATGQTVRLEHITRNARHATSAPLDCVCLLVQRGASRLFLPDGRQDLHADDQLLFAGRESARLEMTWTLSEPQALLSQVSGKPQPRSAIGRWLAG